MGACNYTGIGDVSGYYIGSPVVLPTQTVDPNWPYLTQRIAPSIGAWQCPGCLTYYPVWVGSCHCQQWRTVVSGTMIKINP